MSVDGLILTRQGLRRQGILVLVLGVRQGARVPSANAFCTGMKRRYLVVLLPVAGIAVSLYIPGNAGT